MSELSIAADNLIIFKTEIERIETQLNLLERVLVGTDKDEDYDKDEEHKAFFPLIEKEAPEGFYGMLESVTVHISKSEENNKFIIIPSEKEIEKKILEQCKRSWFVALDLSREYIKKPYQHHEVIIGFDKKDGFYEGSSLGIALTLSFLEQLLKFYNPTYIIKIKEQTAFTGGMTNTGKVLPTGEDIIKQKVNAVFFSEMHTFVIPKCEEAAAQAQLTELKKPYPNRKLKLIPIEDIHDVLNRRDVVDIRKQKLVVRTGKFVKKNWASMIILVLFAISMAFLLRGKVFNNPEKMTVKGSIVFILNKFGDVLGEIQLIDNLLLSDEMLFKFIDVDNDGINEIIWGDNINDEGRVFIANSKLDTLWRYELNRKILFPQNHVGEVFKFRTLKFKQSADNYICLYIIAYSPLYVSYLVEIDLRTFAVKNSLINAGHLLTLEFADINFDGRDEMLLGGISNDWEGACFMVVKSEGFTGQTPVKNPKYRSDFRMADSILAFYCFPLSKIGRFATHYRNWSILDAITINHKEKTIRLEIQEGIIDNSILRYYVTLNFDLDVINFSTGDLFDLTAKKLYNEGEIEYEDGRKYLANEFCQRIIKLKF